MLALEALPWVQKVCLSMVTQALEPLGSLRVWGVSLLLMAAQPAAAQDLSLSHASGSVFGQNLI